MQYFEQKDDFGCGVACVANRLGITYENALLLFDHPENAKTTGYACKYIVKALRRAGVHARLKHINQRKPRPQFNSGDIVFLVKSKRYPFQHYLMRSDEGWMDPWVNMHQSRTVNDAKAGIRKVLPGRPYYYITTD